MVLILQINATQNKLTNMYQRSKAIEVTVSSDDKTFCRAFLGITAVGNIYIQVKGRPALISD